MVKPTAIKAFLLGLCTVLPVALSRHFYETDYLTNLAVSLAIVIYGLLWLIIVHGPGNWKNLRWVPVDPIEKILIRGLSWVAGIGISFVIYETSFTS